MKLMEEIYILMFLLVIFAVAIYLIMQIPEVKDYIVIKTRSIWWHCDNE